MIEIGVSVICMDQINLKRDIDLVEQCGVDYLHIDVMDGHAVPRYGMYVEQARRIAEMSNLPMDIHLMVDDIERCISLFGEVRTVKTISFHIGNTDNAFRYVDAIDSKGKHAGVVLNLDVSPMRIDQLLISDIIQQVTLMGIHPGVLGGTQHPEVVRRKIEIYNEYEEYYRPERIQVDGAVTWDTIPSFVYLGVHALVCGSKTIFSSNDVRSNIDRVMSLVGRSRNV